MCFAITIIIIITMEANQDFEKQPHDFIMTARNKKMANTLNLCSSNKTFISLTMLWNVSDSMKNASLSIPALQNHLVIHSLNLAQLSSFL